MHYLGNLDNSKPMDQLVDLPLIDMQTEQITAGEGRSTGKTPSVSETVPTKITDSSSTPLFD
jgi:hypothetical protein